MKTLMTCLGLALALTAAAPARADYPEHPVKVVVPYAPGGSTDALGRALAQQLEKALGQSFVVDNKPGANTSIGSAAVARAAPDGYTVLIASSASMVLNPLLYPKLAYAPDKDFRLLAIVAEAPLIVVTNDKVPAANIKQFAAYAQANPGRVNYASVGLGNPLQLATELLKIELKFDATHVPYNGSAPALTALMANDTQLMIDVVSTSLPHIRSGRLKALAVTGDKRLKALPDVPTVAESGVPGYRAATWFGVVVPAATPAAVAARLQAAVRDITATPEFRSVLDTQMLLEPPVRTDAEIAAYVARDRSTWGEVIKARHIVLE